MYTKKDPVQLPGLFLVLYCKLLLEQRHLHGLREVACLHGVEVDTSGEPARIPDNRMAACAHELARNRGNLLPGNVEHIDGDRSGFGNAEADGCRRVERVG